jgi:hypothetical protein
MRNISKGHTVKLRETPTARRVQWDENRPSQNAANERNDDEYFQKSQK